MKDIATGRIRRRAAQTVAGTLVCWALVVSTCVVADARPVHHYVFFGQDREALRGASSFLQATGFEGAQIAYSWRQLEPQKGVYDFGPIRDDLAWLAASGKRLFVQIQDVTFSAGRVNVPPYLLQEPQYHGGADRQYHIDRDDEDTAAVEGWMARRWDPVVRERFQKLLAALGSEFDGRIAGINLAETAFEVGRSGRLFPSGFSFEVYRDGIIANMTALRRAFRTSVVMQYANFMPGEWLPDDDKGYLRAVYKAAVEMGVGVGGPDLLPHRRGQLNHSYPLIRNAAEAVPTGIAVQEGNYAEKDPSTGKATPIPDLFRFATEYLRVDYIFWCAEEPYYSRQVVPFVAGAGR